MTDDTKETLTDRLDRLSAALRDPQKNKTHGETMYTCDAALDAYDDAYRSGQLVALDDPRVVGLVDRVKQAALYHQAESDFCAGNGDHAGMVYHENEEAKERATLAAFEKGQGDE